MERGQIETDRGREIHHYTKGLHEKDGHEKVDQVYHYTKVNNL